MTCNLKKIKQNHFQWRWNGYNSINFVFDFITFYCNNRENIKWRNDLFIDFLHIYNSTYINIMKKCNIKSII